MLSLVGVNYKIQKLKYSGCVDVCECTCIQRLCLVGQELSLELEVCP